MDLVTELADVSRALDGAGVPYAVCGGIAVTIHGHVRATKDIDLLIRPEDRERAMAVVAALGFDSAALPMTFGLLAMKRLAGRMQDLADIERLMGGGVDE